MYYRVLSTVLVASALSIGCSEQEAPTAISDLDLAANFINGPPNPGRVIRFQDQSAIVAWNEDYFVVHGMGVLDPAQSPFCTLDPTVFDVFDFQISNALLVQSQGTQHVYSDGAADLTTCVEEECPEFCNLLQGPRAAEGHGNLQINQNAVSATLRAQGTLQDLVAGGCARLTMVLKLVAPPGGSPASLVENIGLNHIGSLTCMN